MANSVRIQALLDIIWGDIIPHGPAVPVSKQAEKIAAIYKDSDGKDFDALEALFSLMFHPLRSVRFTVLCFLIRFRHWFDDSDNLKFKKMLAEPENKNIIGEAINAFLS